MGAILAYFRTHRWQRRTLTVLAAVAIGTGASLLLHRPIRTWRLVRDLGSPDAAVREAAALRGAAMGGRDPSLAARLERELGTPDDAKFHAVARVLAALGRFNSPGRDANQIDRLRLVEFLSMRAAGRAGGETAKSSPAGEPASAPASTRPAPSPAEIAAETRYLLFQESVFAGRDNAYTRRLLAAAAKDESPTIRQASAVLAARFADANTLKLLLDDGDPNVSEWAAIDAGLADLQDLAGAILESPAIPGPAAMCALARLDPSQFDVKMRTGLPRAREHDDKRLEESVYLLAVQTRPVSMRHHLVESVRQRWLLDMPWPHPAVLLAMGLVEGWSSEGTIVDVLRAATRDAAGLTQSHLLAALEAARRHDLPIRAETNAIVRGLWRENLAQVQVKTCELLGGQVDRLQRYEANRYPDLPNLEPFEYDPGSLPPLDPVFAQTAIDTLRQAALYETEPNSPDFALALPSAAAAVALWVREPSASFLQQTTADAAGRTPEVHARGEPQASPSPYPLPEGEGFAAPHLRGAAPIDPNSTAYLIYRASSREHHLAGDYIAWHLGRAESNAAREKAFRLGMNLLPSPTDPRDANSRGWRNYSVSSRATAAMILALAARTDNERKAARERIEARLAGGPGGAPSDFHEVGTYKCALLILGEARYARDVRELLQTGAFPPRRAITALTLAGDRAGLDWLLWDVRASTDEIATILTGTLLGEVLQQLVPELPAVEAAAGDDLRNWQTRILQDYYRIHRERIRFAPREQERAM